MKIECIFSAWMKHWNNSIYLKFQVLSRQIKQTYLASENRLQINFLFQSFWVNEISGKHCRRDAAISLPNRVWTSNHRFKPEPGLFFLTRTSCLLQGVFGSIPTGGRIKLKNTATLYCAVYSYPRCFFRRIRGFIFL